MVKRRRELSIKGERPYGYVGFVLDLNCEYELNLPLYPKEVVVLRLVVVFGQTPVLQIAT